MIQSLIGKKIDQTQGFLENGKRVPLSIISVASNVVSQVKTLQHEGYNSVQLGFGINNKPNKPTLGHSKKAGIEKTPRFFREIRVDETPDVTVAQSIIATEVFEPGDIVDVSGTSKGKGYAGVVKRHGFHGGPKTHGQSDRHRAPGASGQGTTPGRVYRGKRMSGRMGNENTTVKNLEILQVDADQILVKGLIPGIKGSIVVINKVGKNKKFMPLWTDAPQDETPVQTPRETIETPQDTVATPEEQIKTEEDVKTVEDTVETPEAATTQDTEKQDTENTEGGNENGNK